MKKRREKIMSKISGIVPTQTSDDQRVAQPRGLQTSLLNFQIDKVVVRNRVGKGTFTGDSAIWALWVSKIGGHTFYCTP